MRAGLGPRAEPGSGRRLSRFRPGWRTACAWSPAARRAPCALVLGAVEADLAQGVHDAEDRVTVVPDGVHLVLTELLPRRVLAGLFRLGAAGVGQREPAPPAALLADDQALVLQQLQGRVDRARARPPYAAGPLVELLDHLVAVHRALGEQ